MIAAVRPTPHRLDDARLRPHLRTKPEPEKPIRAGRSTKHPRDLEAIGVKVLSRNRGRLIAPPVRPPNAFPRTTRKEILRASRRKCYLCRRELILSTMEVDHIIPAARGGTNHRSNLIASCRPCNQLKTDHIVAFGIKTRKPHFIPW